MESQSAFAYLFQSVSRKALRAHLLGENQTGAGGKVEGGDSSGDRDCIGQERTARAGAWRAVLHDVEAAVLKRPRHELASPRDVLCCGPCGEKLGSRSARLADDGGGRP